MVQGLKHESRRCRRYTSLSLLKRNDVSLSFARALKEMDFHSSALVLSEHTLLLLFSLFLCGKCTASCLILPYQQARRTSTPHKQRLFLRTVFCARCSRRGSKSLVWIFRKKRICCVYPFRRRENVQEVNRAGVLG